MGVGPMTRWRQAEVVDLAKRLRWAIGVSVLSAVIAPMLLGSWSPMTGLGLLLAAWVASTAVVNLVAKVREHRAPNWLARFTAQPGSYYGMLLAHFGIAVFIVGVTVVSSYQSENDVRMEPGDTATVGGFGFKLDSVAQIKGANYTASRATLTVTDGDKVIATLKPERRVYTVRSMPMTEVAIDRGVTRDLYVALGEPVSDTAWSVRLHHKPFVNWIWFGCVLMSLGGLLAVLDRRYRAVRVAAKKASPAIGPQQPSLPTPAAAKVSA
jgi:cytochrome c-type biogenesis protein CcmF